MLHQPNPQRELETDASQGAVNCMCPTPNKSHGHQARGAPGASAPPLGEETGSSTCESPRSLALHLLPGPI